jgi:hypothetical protein
MDTAWFIKFLIKYIYTKKITGRQPSTDVLEGGCRVKDFTTIVCKNKNSTNVTFGRTNQCYGAVLDGPIGGYVFCVGNKKKRGE